MNPPASNVVQGELQGYKVAELLLGPADVWFRGAGAGGDYGPHDQAVCVVDADHVPPHPGCACGFYAWRDRTAATTWVNEDLIAVLDVGLWGAFHEFEHGYVAAAQTVRSVELVPWCTRCLVQTQPQIREAVGLAATVQPKGGTLRPACQEHVGASDRLVTPEDLAAGLQVPVRWANPDGEVARAARRLVHVQSRVVPRPVRRIDDLILGESAHVFQNAIAQGPGRQLWLDPLARLVQPLPGTDIPIHLAEDGTIEVDTSGIDNFDGFRPRTDSHRYSLAVRHHRRTGLSSLIASARRRRS